VSLNVKIENTVSDRTEANTHIDGEDLIVRIVDKALSDGRLDNGLNTQSYRLQGTDFQ